MIQKFLDQNGIPDGRGLDWVTIVSALAPLYDVSAAYVNRVIPILEEGGHAAKILGFGIPKSELFRNSASEFRLCERL